MQQQHTDRELDAAIARFLQRQGDVTHMPSAEELRAVALSFGAHYTVVDKREGLRFQLAGVLEKVGVLECHIETSNHNGSIVRVYEYRRRGLQQVAA